MNKTPFLERGIFMKSKASTKMRVQVMLHEYLILYYHVKLFKEKQLGQQNE